MKLRKRPFYLYALVSLLITAVNALDTGLSLRWHRFSLAAFSAFLTLVGLSLVIIIPDMAQHFRKFRWTAADWPYDAKRKGWLAKHRFPEVSPYGEPKWCYLAMFDSDSNGTPTKREMRMLVSYLDFIRGNLRIAMDGDLGTEWRPFDIATDFVWQTVIFHKFGYEDWGFRRARSPHLGYWPRVAPHPSGRMSVFLPRKASLLVILNEACSPGGRPSEEWELWKRRHPDVFS